MNPEKASTSPEQVNETVDETEIIDPEWLLSRIVAILYFIDFQFGNEATTVIEQVAKQIEANVRNGEGDES